MQLGDWRLDTVDGGRFSLDGGAMFGVVPKPLWSKARPADALNRIPCACHCVLCRDGERIVLIETGYGGKLTEKERELYAASPGEPLVESLAALGVAPDDVDAVVLSHLHFDHAGGCTRRDEQGRLAPTFPRARHYVQMDEWNAATSGAAELKGSYPLENLLPLAEAGLLEPIVGGGEILPGLRSLLTPGHTRGHQSLVLESRGQTAIFLGDMCPTSAHLRSLWCMAYDVYPLETRRNKPHVLGQAADEGWLILWDHDPDHAASRLARDDKKEFITVENFARL